MKIGSIGKALSLRTLIAGYFIGSAIYFFYGSVTDIIEKHHGEAESIRSAFSVREVQDSFVRPFDLPGIDTSWFVHLGGKVVAGRTNFIAWHQDSVATRYQFGRYNLISGAAETIALDFPAGSRVYPPWLLGGDELIWAQLEGASETGGLLSIRGRSNDPLVTVPVPGALQIIGWAAPNAILLSMSDWERETISIRGQDGSESRVLGWPKPTSYRMIRFREESETQWAVVRLDLIPRFLNNDGAARSNSSASFREVMILSGDSSAVVLRNTQRSIRGPSEEWIYKLDRREKEPRGVFIDGLENPPWAAPNAECYGRVRLYVDNQQETDTQALAAENEQQHGAIERKRPRKRLEWVSGGKIYLVDEYSDSWTVGLVFRLEGREFWLFAEKIERESGFYRPPSVLRLSLLDDATKTIYNFTCNSSGRFPRHFAYDKAAAVIYFAVLESTGWTVRCISFAGAGCRVESASISDSQSVPEGAEPAAESNTQSIPESAQSYLGRHFYYPEGDKIFECVIMTIELCDYSDLTKEYPTVSSQTLDAVRDRVSVSFKSVPAGYPGTPFGLSGVGGSRMIRFSELSGVLDTIALSRFFAPEWHGVIDSTTVSRLSVGEVMAAALQRRCGPSNSIIAAERRGVLAKKLTSDNHDIAHRGDHARLTEIWTETCTNPTPQWKEDGVTVPHYHLCFATNKAASHYRRMFPSFWLTGLNICFDVTHSGDTAVFFSPAIASPPSFPVSVLSSDFQRKVVFTAHAQ